MHLFNFVFGYYLNKEGQFEESVFVLEKATSIAKDPKFQKYESHPEAELAFAIAQYGLSPSQELAADAQHWLDEGAPNNEAMRSRLRVQMVVAEKLGLKLDLKPAEVETSR